MSVRDGIVRLALVGACAALLGPAGAATATGIPSSVEGGTFVPAPAPRGRMPAASLRHAAVDYSLNWSGYAQSARRGTFTGVEATWTVPTVSTAAPGSQYAADWVGVGGFSDKTLVQAGTSVDNVDGTAQYQAWTETLPASSQPLAMTVSPGDSITTLVHETAPRTWLMQVSDNTTGVTQSRSVRYRSKGESVEVIHEVPEVCDPQCAIGTLATTTDVAFQPGYYTSRRQTSFQPLLVPAIAKQRKTRLGATPSYASLYQLVMTTQTSVILAAPSSPDSDNDGFSVADGPGAPSPPSP
jgi:hypothetical protein